MIADSDSEFENKSVIIWVDEKENAPIFKEKSWILAELLVLLQTRMID